MKKTLLSLLSLVFIAASCTSEKPAQAPREEQVKIEQSQAYYSEWDKAIRIDVDMQNMFTNAPRKLEKPIDMYMAFALALKNNYTRRMVSYEQSMIEAGKSSQNRIPEILSAAGYVNDTNSDQLSPDLKVAWNILDLSIVYYQTKDKEYQSNVAFEQSRKVIHNILQEVRVLYWKTLSAQKLLPVIDDMTEYMVLEVDEINAKGKQQALPTADLVKKRKYMEAVKNLAALRRKLETSEVRLASLMGFHPSTEYKLVGPEYGNFELPEIKNKLAELEWLALSNRPELRVHDLETSPHDLKIAIKGFEDPGQSGYKANQNHYNTLWSKNAKEYGLNVIEDVRNPNSVDMRNLRRQRMTSLVLSQVYVSWAQYMSAVEDYQINMEIASTSENIAEDITMLKGPREEVSQLEASRAIEDEIKAYLAYVDVQESLGNLYSTIGLDALPYYMLNEKPSRIALYLRGSLTKWRTGELLPDNRPYLMKIPTKRPPVNLSSTTILPDIRVETGQKVRVQIPQSLINKMDVKGKITTKCGLQDDSPLPKWLKYDEHNMIISGTPMPSDEGKYNIKTYIADENGNIGYSVFKIEVIEVFVPSIRVMGLTEGRRATVLKRCQGSSCKDDYITKDTLGKEVEKRAR